MKRKVAIALCVGVIVIAGIILWPKAKHFMDVDYCLDSGGRYDYALSVCDCGDEGA